MSSNPGGGAGGSGAGGGPPTATVIPDDHAVTLAEQLVVSDLNELVLNETLDAAEDGAITESGRTVCSSFENVQPPIGRHPMSVDLAGCRPWDATGIIHSHVTPDELRNPTHSLPDVANVLYGNADASIIPGAETTHAIVTPTDETLPEAQAIFANVIGVEVDSPEDVSRAVDEGAIRALDDAQRRLMDQLDPITDRFEFPRNTIAARLDALGVDMDPETMVPAEMAFMDRDEDVETPRPPEPAPTPRTHDTPDGPASDPSALASACERHRTVATRFRESVDDDTSQFLRATIISNVIGTIVGGIVSRAVFGD